MEVLGDLERAFVTAIYPNRLPLAAVGLIALTFVALITWRRRWDLVARRRPGRTVAVAVIALGLAGPLVWYLGSPLVLSSTIDEPPPIGAPRERTGRFIGADDFHFGRGTARLIESAPGSFTIRLEDFEVRNGPDLYVYLSPSPDGYVTDAVELGRLKADRGNQNYPVPAGTDVPEARSVVIWCKQFVVLFATATLS